MLRRSYTEHVRRKRLEYGDKFDASALAQQFIHYFESGERIEVQFRNDEGEVYETKRGTVGITTGWKPCFLLMLTRRSSGSHYVLSTRDEVVKVIR